MDKDFPKTVEALEHFPFKNFNAFKMALSDESAKFSVDISMALDWAQKEGYAYGKITLLGVLFPVSVLGFIAYIVVTRSWFLFLAVPVFFLVFPLILTNQRFTGWLMIALVAGIIGRVGWLIALSLPALIFSCTNYMATATAGEGLAAALPEREDLLCAIWSRGALKVTLPNGDMYCSFCKIEGGKTIPYKE